MVAKKVSKKPTRKVTKKKKTNVRLIPEEPDMTDVIVKEIEGRRYFVVLMHKGLLYDRIIVNKSVSNAEVIAACQAIIHSELNECFDE